MGNVPRELRKTTLPEYIIEPPDVLLIEAVNNIRPEYAPIHAGEALLVQVNRTIPYGQQEDPVAQQFKQINGIFVIGADGYLNLGPEYGKVLVAEQPLPEIQSRVENHLRQILTNPQVLVTLPRPENSQYVAGPHLVRPDGTVGWGFMAAFMSRGCRSMKPSWPSSGIWLSTYTTLRFPWMCWPTTARCITSSQMAVEPVSPW